MHAIIQYLLDGGGGSVVDHCPCMQKLGVQILPVTVIPSLHSFYAKCSVTGVNDTGLLDETIKVETGVTTRWLH